MIELRHYQANAIHMLYEWFRANPTGNPIVSACVGAGKSVMIAQICKDAAHGFDSPGRVLVVVPSKELAEQNLEKLVMLGTGLRIGVMSASMGRKDFVHDKDVVIGTVGTLAKRADRLGFFDLCLIDECHLVRREDDGMYRELIRGLQRNNAAVRVIGWTGTPFRGNGVWLTEGETRLFTDIAARVTMRDLLKLGFLSPLVVSTPSTTVTGDGVGMRNGDYIVSQLAQKLDRPELTRKIAGEICDIGRDRKKWLVFCCTVEHAEHMAAELTALGVSAAVVSADTPKAKREECIARFRSGRIQAICNVAVLTTGFDVPEIDLIALVRNTKSPVLYCLDSETEILTSHGWKGIGEVSVGDCALSMDIPSGSGSWSRVIGVVRRHMEHIEKWVEYDAPRANFRVTDQHRMIFKAAKFNKSHVETPFEFHSAADMALYKDSVYMPTAVHINNPGVPLNDDELYLIGMVMTDGTIRPNQLFISQSERYPDILSRIEETLNRLGLTWRKRKVPKYGESKNIVERHSRWVFHISMGKPRKGTEKRSALYLLPYLDKDLSPSLMSLSKSQFIKLWEGIFDGDGCKMVHKKDWIVRSSTVVSARKTCVDRLQALAVMHGFTANLRWSSKGRTNPIAYLTIKDQDWRSVGGSGDRPKIRISDATNEEVWCVETELGTIVTRRRGKVTVMGNCQIAGRGMRITPHKTNCLWLDFTDTTALLGPVDAISGRAEPPKKEHAAAPFKICAACGANNPAGALACVQCGAAFPDPEPKINTFASQASILTSEPKLESFPVDRVSFDPRVSRSTDMPYLRINFHSGLDTFHLNLMLEHDGFPRRKALQQLRELTGYPMQPVDVSTACKWLSDAGFQKVERITVDMSTKWKNVIGWKIEKRASA